MDSRRQRKQSKRRGRVRRPAKLCRTAHETNRNTNTWREIGRSHLSIVVSEAALQIQAFLTLGQKTLPAVCGNAELTVTVLRLESYQSRRTASGIQSRAWRQ